MAIVQATVAAAVACTRGQVSVSHVRNAAAVLEPAIQRSPNSSILEYKGQMALFVQASFPWRRRCVRSRLPIRVIRKRYVPWAARAPIPAHYTHHVPFMG